MRVARNYSLFLLLALLVACGSMNLRANIKAAIDSADSYTVRTTKLLQADLITVPQAEERLAKIKQAQAALRIATAEVKTCDTTKPETCNAAIVSYNSANALLGEVENWLIQQEARKPK